MVIIIIRVYLEECRTDGRQEDSFFGSKHHLVSFSSMDIDGDQRPSVPSDLNGISVMHDTWTTRDDEGAGPLQDQEMGSRSIEIVGSSIPEEIGTSPSEGELSTEFWIPPEPEDGFDDTNSSFINDDDDDDEEFGDGISWGKPSSLSGFEEERSGSHKFKEEKQRALEEVKNGKLKVLVYQLLKSVGVVSSNDGESWVDIVTSLSWDAAKFVKPDAAEGKAMDPDGYVKIKCVASGSPTQRF